MKALHMSVRGGGMEEAAHIGLHAMQIACHMTLALFLCHGDGSATPTVSSHLRREQ